MSDQNDEAQEAELFETPVGIRLKQARENKGLTLDDISRQTRISLRQLEAIEASDYDALPARTYSIGFVKSFASEVDLDPQELSQAYRSELEFSGTNAGGANQEYFEPADPARVPPASLAWIAAGIALVLIIAYAI